ncbi:site-specific integrase [Bradyrhizobium yuanmingense]|uniref:site-specific integrase n=1 Tax=Bradyrhizobium yuanmingense TaxID=108015 RepID=UPI0023B9BA1B|nr:site-specific integrase [Bradyrhizobium yuanmingense]MDF0520639.1 site-specific integrase [Bradyrhizobium yuanmingense]
MEIQADRSELPADGSVLKTVKLADLITRYRKEMTPKKRGGKIEDAVLARMLLDPICKLPLSVLRPADFARYRDRRLACVAPTTLKRQLNPVQHMFEIAKRDWAIPIKENPIKALRFSAKLRMRTRRLNPGELNKIMKAARSCRRSEIVQIIQLALATGMRRGEIARMQWKDLDTKRRLLTIPVTKNGHARTIPLSNDAIKALPKRCSIDGRVFSKTGNAIHLAWDRITERAGISDLRFHDLRHEAISRFFELGLTIPEVATISGHRDATMLLRYAHASSKAVFKKLNQAA